MKPNIVIFSYEVAWHTSLALVHAFGVDMIWERFIYGSIYKESSVYT